MTIIEKFNQTLVKFTILRNAAFFEEKDLIELKNDIEEIIQEITNELVNADEVPKGKEGKEEISINISELMNEKTPLLIKNLKSVSNDTSPQVLLSRLEKMLVFVDKFQKYFQQEQIKTLLPEKMPEILLHAENGKTINALPQDILKYILSFY